MNKRQKNDILDKAVYKLVMQTHDGMKMIYLVTEITFESLLKDYQERKPIAFQNLDGEWLLIDSEFIRIAAAYRLLQPTDWLDVFSKLAKNAKT